MNRFEMAQNRSSPSPYSARLLPNILQHLGHLPEQFLPLRLKHIIPIGRKAHRDLFFARLEPSNCFVSELPERYSD